MALDFGSIFESMLKMAAKTAKDTWEKIRKIASTQVKVMAREIVEIGEGLANGEFSLASAKDTLAVVKAGVIRALAEATILVRAAAQKIINAAISAVKSVVNTAIGLPFLA